MDRVKNFFLNYWQNLKSIHFNCRILLLYLFFSGVAVTVAYLLLNLYLVELGLSKEQVGLFTSVNSLASAAMALPLALLLQRMPRKYPIIWASFLYSLSFIAICFVRDFGFLLVLSFLMGASNIVIGILIPPFLMENSSEEERTHLFSVFAAQGWASSMLGNCLGGFLPVLFKGVALGPGLLGQYRTSLLVPLLLALLITPLLFLIDKEKRVREKSIQQERGSEARYQVRFAMSKFLFIEMVIFLGSGLFMPFMNLYFSGVHAAGSEAIGIVFTLASAVALLMTMASPILAQRFGKVRATFLCQALAIPLLVGLALIGNFYVASALYAVRMGLMNMVNPLMDSFAMEIVPARRRVVFSSLIRSTQPLGWGLMAPLAGFFMQNYGFTPQLLMAAALYTISSLSWLIFFSRTEKSDDRKAAVGQS